MSYGKTESGASTLLGPTLENSGLISSFCIVIVIKLVYMDVVFHFWLSIRCRSILLKIKKKTVEHSYVVLGMVADWSKVLQQFLGHLWCDPY